jgi:hypothetical protein
MFGTLDFLNKKKTLFVGPSNQINGQFGKKNGNFSGTFSHTFNSASYRYACVLNSIV